MQDISVRVRLCAGHISEGSVMCRTYRSVRVRLCAGYISEGSVMCRIYQ